MGNWDIPCVCALSTWPLSVHVSPLPDRTLRCLVLNGALFSVLYPVCCIHAQCLSVVLGSLEAAQACSVLATRDTRKAVEGLAPSRRSVSLYKSYLVDPASSHMLVSKIKPCMSKYECHTVKLRTAHYISYSFFDGPFLHG